MTRVGASSGGRRLSERWCSNLRIAGKSGGMTDDQVEKFMEVYLPTYEYCLPKFYERETFFDLFPRCKRGMFVRVDENRNCTDIEVLQNSQVATGCGS